MKLKYLVAPLLFAAAAATGCQESAETYPAIYMTDAQNNPDKSMTIDEPPAETSITVSSSVVMEHDVRIQLEVRPELLAAYNDKYGKNYQIPPEESYALSSKRPSWPATTPLRRSTSRCRPSRSSPRA